MSQWRREALRTNFWLVPSMEVIASIFLFWATLEVDRAVYHGTLTLPAWVGAGSADTAREILLAVAAAIMTVIGINFSVTIVTLTLASTQFGPRMLRNFIRDRGTQLTLGTFVATAVYCVLVLLAIGPAEHGVFVPHFSVSVVFLLVLVDLAVLIYFLHHIAIQIQLPFVIASIAGDLRGYLGVRKPDIRMSTANEQDDSEEIAALVDTIKSSGAMMRTPKGGYLQAIRYDMLIRAASAADAVVHLPYRPGNFLVEDSELAAVWPPEAADRMSRRLKRAQVTGPVRNLAQDPAFGIDQLVEIANSGALAGGQRHIHRTDVRGLARQHPVQARESVEAGPGVPRPYRCYPGHLRAGQLPKFGPAVLRQGPPGQPRNARPADAPTRSNQSDHGADHRPRPGPSADGRSRHDPARQPRVGARRVRPRRRGTPLQRRSQRVCPVERLCRQLFAPGIRFSPDRGFRIET